MSLADLGRHWKALLVLGLLALGIGYAAKRVLGSWRGEGPPPWLHQQSHRSAAIPRPTRDAYRHLLGVADKAQIQYRGICFLELGEKPSDSILWSSEPISNESFRPLERVGTRWNGSRSQLLGYYLPDGTPLAYTTQVNPNHPAAFAVLIHLEQALTPGQKSWVLRRQRHHLELLAESNASYQFRLPAHGPNLLCGVHLGAHARLVSFKPKRNNLVADSETGLLGWHGAQPVPSIEFAAR